MWSTVLCADPKSLGSSHLGQSASTSEGLPYSSMSSISSSPLPMTTMSTSLSMGAMSTSLSMGAMSSFLSASASSLPALTSHANEPVDSPLNMTQGMTSHSMTSHGLPPHGLTSHAPLQHSTLAPPHLYVSPPPPRAMPVTSDMDTKPSQQMLSQLSLPSGDSHSMNSPGS